MSIEMTSPNSLNRVQSQVATFQDLFQNAARAKYGDSIEILPNPTALSKLNTLDFSISIASADPRPTEARKAIVDVTTKEYTNHGEKEVDESLVKVRKSSSEWKGSRYHFSTTRGGYYGIGGDIGPQVIHLAIAGGSTTISVNYNNPSKAIAKAREHNLDFDYIHEEKISVPPKSRVKARITSHSVNYEQKYAILFKIPSSVQIPVTFRTRCQQMMCCMLFCRCSTMGFISAAQLCCTLPDYQNRNGYVSFLQHGILSWIGEGSTVNKEVESL